MAQGMAVALDETTAMRRQARIVRVSIISVGLLCFLLLAWDHLGLGALLLPPVPSPHQQTATVGTTVVQMTAASGKMLARGQNTLSFTILQAGRSLGDAIVRVQPTMTTMPMVAPTVTATAPGAGLYVAHPVFGMAGTWRVKVTVAPPDQPAFAVTFPLSVDWS